MMNRINKTAAWLVAAATFSVAATFLLWWIFGRNGVVHANKSDLLWKSYPTSTPEK